jgi:predicted RNase H-like HicB family nuclease
MTQILYPAIIEKASPGYSVFFPDIPGCVSAGNTIQDAAINAEEALAGHILVATEHGEEIPAARALDSIERDPDVEEVARILVRADLPGKAQRINITLDEGLIAAIDRVAKNRSGFLADAARAALAARQLERP